MLGGFGIVVFTAFPARPKGLFVELNALLGGTAEDHHTQHAVAEGGGLVPVAGGGVEPKLVFFHDVSPFCGQEFEDQPVTASLVVFLYWDLNQYMA